MPLHLENLLPPQIDALDREKTIVLFPVAGMEDFGPHLPIGLPLKRAEFEAKQWSEKVEKNLKGYQVVIYPTAPLNIQSVTQRYAPVQRGYILRDFLVDSCRSLARSGFKHFFCISASCSPRQLTAIEEAGLTLDKPWSFIFGLPRIKIHSLSSFGQDFSHCRNQLLWPSPNEHGGKTDSSVALHICADLVPDLASALPPNEREASAFQRFLMRLRRRTRDYWGDPSAASAQFGENLLEKKSQLQAEAATRVVLGQPSGRNFRSFYSWIPLNWSYLIVWLMTAGLLLVFAAWLALFFSSF